MDRVKIVQATHAIVSWARDFCTWRVRRHALRGGWWSIRSLELRRIATRLKGVADVESALIAASRGKPAALDAIAPVPPQQPVSSVQKLYDGPRTSADIEDWMRDNRERGAL